MSPQSACFAAWFALSALFHVLNNSGSFRMLSEPTDVSWWYLALSIVGLSIVLLPTRTGRSVRVLMVTLSVLVLVTVWLEAPILGNHWLVSGLVALGIALAALQTCLRPSTGAWAQADHLVLPVARSVFFVFYSFSALAKLNRAFLDPSVSCANFFAEETARSLGWRSAEFTGTGSWHYLLPWAVVCIELAVVVLLLIPRTRLWGVVLAVLFHGVIALDGEHPFADFTSLVYAFMVLFLPDDFFVWVRTAAGAHLRAAIGIARAAAALAMAVLIVVQGLLLGPSWWGVLDDLKDSVWRVMGAASAGILSWYAVQRVRSRRSAQDGSTADEGSAAVIPPVRWLLVVPVLAVLNGLTPYVGVKTGNSWNMYSNLETADGYENGLLVPVVWRWTHRQDDLVRIIGSSDPVLDGYARNGYLVPMTNLRDYLSRSGPVSLRFVRLEAADGGAESGAANGSVVQVDDSSAAPELSRPLSSWERRLFAYRVVDTEQPARCQDSYLPLR